MMSFKSLSVCAALALLSACATANNGFRDAAGVDSIHKASVSFEERSQPIKFSAGKLSANEEASLAAFASASGLSYADRLTLRSSEPNMSADYRAAVNVVLGRFGLAVGNVETVVGLPQGAAMLVVSRASVALPQCGVQSGPNNFNVNNENMSNFGCATRSNLAAMAANPADLISGNRLDGQTADVTAKPVDAYGSHELTGMESKSKKTWTAQGPVPK